MDATAYLLRLQVEPDLVDLRAGLRLVFVDLFSAGPD